MRCQFTDRHDDWLKMTIGRMTKDDHRTREHTPGYVVWYIVVQYVVWHIVVQYVVWYIVVIVWCGMRSFGEIVPPKRTFPILGR
ncbi:hypothetical protein CEXT_618551 [Caerostris extrusa]|uniref:Uncharacterized protein n=1 Tax=Caerostris extrusa TaxID=172846 RepID=A0AAV4P3B8_CAEEX|nr:hypothetical protein CEXT_618551 [Caerostris extrusa]